MIEYYYPGYPHLCGQKRPIEQIFDEADQPCPLSGYLVSFAFRKSFYSLWKHDMEKARAHYDNYGLKILADSGAFSFIDEPIPPVSVLDVIDFQNHIDADLGVSLDHIIPDYDSGYDYFFGGIQKPPMFKERMDITLENGSAYLEECTSQGVRFTPIGAIQGWSPESYLECLKSFQKMGYKRVALGGVANLRSTSLLEILSALKPHIGDTQLHLLGIVQPSVLRGAGMKQITSVDGMGPHRNSIANYGKGYRCRGTYWQVIPPLDPKKTERLDVTSLTFEEVNECLVENPYIVSQRVTRDQREEALALSLRERIWEECPCAVCRELGWKVLQTSPHTSMMRAFHNIFAFTNEMNNIPY
jgi:hypothetical protein